MKNACLAKSVRGRSWPKLVVVQSVDFRCLAYRDTAGKLRNFWNQKLVSVPIHVLDPEN